MPRGILLIDDDRLQHRLTAAHFAALSAFTGFTSGHLTTLWATFTGTFFALSSC